MLVITKPPRRATVCMFVAVSCSCLFRIFNTWMVAFNVIHNTLMVKHHHVQPLRILFRVLSKKTFKETHTVIEIVHDTFSVLVCDMKAHFAESVFVSKDHNCEVVHMQNSDTRIRANVIACTLDSAFTMSVECIIVHTLFMILMFFFDRLLLLRSSVHKKITRTSLSSNREG